MKTATIEISHFDHPAWIAKLKSYKNEIGVLERRLSELASRCQKPNEFARVEHFQNQFIVQKSNVNDILHNIKMDNKEYQYEQISHSPSNVTSRLREHSMDLATTFERTMIELQSDFESFSSKFVKR
jgi:uncharacterized protein (DUF342 family)